MPADAVSIVKKFYPDVERVKDGGKAITIVVTKPDINSGDVKNHKECAMARACRRQLHLDGAIISISTAYLVKDDTATRYRIQASLAREIIAFDKGGSFAPGEYTLFPTSDEHHKLKTPKGGHQKPGRGGPSHASRYRHVTSGIRSSLLAAV